MLTEEGSAVLLDALTGLQASEALSKYSDIRLLLRRVLVPQAIFLEAALEILDEPIWLEEALAASTLCLD